MNISLNYKAHSSHCWLKDLDLTRINNYYMLGLGISILLTQLLLSSHISWKPYGHIAEPQILTHTATCISRNYNCCWATWSFSKNTFTPKYTNNLVYNSVWIHTSNMNFCFSWIKLVVTLSLSWLLLLPFKDVSTCSAEVTWKVLGTITSVFWDALF